MKSNCAEEIKKYMRDNHVHTYSQIVRYARNKKPEWVYTLRAHPSWFKRYGQHVWYLDGKIGTFPA